MGYYINEYTDVKLTCTNIELIQTVLKYYIECFSEYGDEEQLQRMSGLCGCWKESLHWKDVTVVSLAVYHYAKKHPKTNASIKLTKLVHDLQMEMYNSPENNAPNGH